MMFLSWLRGYLSPLHNQSIIFVGLRRKGGKPAEETDRKHRNTGSGSTAGLCRRTALPSLLINSY